MERRILAGERKADIVGQAAVDGEDWQAVAQMVALIPTPARRRRYRWLNRALMLVLALAAVGEVAGAVSYETGVWLVLVLVFPASFLVALSGVARFRARAYLFANGTAVIRLGWWVFSVAIHHTVDVPVALIAVQIALSAGVIVLAMATLTRLLPATHIWMDVSPKTDAAGTPVFEE